MSSLIHIHHIITTIAAAQPPVESTPISPAGLPTPAPDQTTIQTVLEIVRNTIGALALLMLTVSGLRYILAGDNPERTSKAKNGIVYALVGVTIAVVAEALVAFVVNRV